MKYSFDGFNYLIRLDKGDRLSEVLIKFTEETKIEGAWVSGIGGTLEATLGFYDIDNKKYDWRQFDGLHELVSLSGNLAYDEDGKFVFHLHAVLADDKFQTVGGHVKDLIAAATVELFVHATEGPLKRKMDEDVGLKTLNL